MTASDTAVWCGIVGPLQLSENNIIFMTASWARAKTTTRTRIQVHVVRGSNFGGSLYQLFSPFILLIVYLSAMSDSASTSYTLSPAAYAIPILHSALHPSSSTTGLFLSSSPASSAEITITHAIPLQHHNISLTPYTELGLELATAHAESKGARVVGMYICHEGDGGGLGRVGEKLLAKLKEGYAGAFGLVLDNAKLANGEGAFNVSLCSALSLVECRRRSPVEIWAEVQEY